MDDPAEARDKILALLRDPANLPAATRHLGCDLTDVDVTTNTVEAWFTGKPEFRNPNGSVQGGIVTAFLDEAMSLALFVSTRMKAAVPTLEMKTSFLRPMMSERARVVGRVVRLGSSVGFTEGWLYNEDGVLCATASATAAIRPFEEMGVKRSDDAG